MPDTTPKISQEDFTKLGTELEGLLARYHPYVQGAAITAMLTNWLGRTPPEQRKQVLEKLLKSVYASIEDTIALGKGHDSSGRSH